MDREQKEKYMRMAISLAVKAKGCTSPNPLVGAVIVKDGRVIGSGYHERYGELHAERNALKNCTEDPKGSTCFVTLEPCCHQGKQPPCTDALIEAGVSSVVVGSMDPNPLVAGKGIEILKNAGITVETGFLKEECDSINKVFFHYITGKRPYVTMKYAMTLDGKIATAKGESKWISCEASRKYVHEMRAENMGIMVGIGTVLADDPMLDVRDADGLSPVRIICDTDLRTPLTSKVMETAPHDNENGIAPSAPAKGAYRDYLPKTVIATAVTDEDKLAPYREKGAEIITLPKGENGMIDLSLLMEILGEMKIDSVLLEGGGTLNWSMLSGGLVDHAACFISTKIFGGEDALSPVRGEGVDLPSDAFTLENATVRAVGSDMLTEGDIVKR